MFIPVQVTPNDAWWHTSIAFIQKHKVIDIRAGIRCILNFHTLIIQLTELEGAIELRETCE